jgi:hypothetical protein
MKQHKPKPAKAKEVGPARNLIKKSPFRTTGGAFIAGLTPYAAQWESYLERYAIPTFALCHDVQTILSQPFTEDYKDSFGKDRSYTPDFLIKTTQGRELVIEIKSLRFMFSEQALDIHTAIANHFLPKSQIFRFCVDKQIEDQPRFNSVKLLFRYVTSNISKSLADTIFPFMGNEPICIFELMKLSKAGLGDIYALIAQKHLSIDWSQPLNKDAYVSLPNKPFKGLEIDDILSCGQFSNLLAELAMGIRPENKRLMAGAQVGRRLDRSAGAFSVVAGFPRTAPIRDLKPNERAARSAWDRADQAPGRRPSKKTSN